MQFDLITENVPGWLNMPDNAFGCFLAGLVGADDPLLPCVMPKGRRGNDFWRWDEDSERLVPRWPSSGMVAGPWARVAWRVLDAQYFGLAQRRERVFAVAGFGDGTDPAEILFECKSLQRDTPARRKAGEDIAPTISARSSAGGGLGTDFDLDGGLIEVTSHEVAQTLLAKANSSHRLDAESYVAHALRAEGFDASEDGTGRGTPIVPVSYAIQERAVSENLENGPQGLGIQADIAYTLEARNKVQAVAFGGNRQSGSNVDAAALNAKGGSGRMDFESETLIAFSSKDHGADAQTDMAPTMRAMGHAESHANAGGQLAVAFALRGREGGAMPEMSGEQVGALRAASGGSSRDYVAHYGVRRLTPRECERLQGFPDDWTKIPRGKNPAEECPDGPRYKAIGNSFPVPVIRWIGERIMAQHKRRMSA